MTKTTDRHWLVRTHRNHILGPMGKDKILDMIEKGQLIGEDELCSGNGHWFYIREKELLDLYVYGEAVQGFNPVSDASIVLSPAPEEESDEDVFQLDLDEDSSPLELSEEPPSVTDDKGLASGPESINRDKNEDDDTGLPSHEDLEYPNSEKSD